MFVIIVGDGTSDAVDTPIPIKPLKVDKIINTAVKMGKFLEVNIKEEPHENFDVNSEDFEDRKLLEELNNIKSEPSDVDSDQKNTPLGSQEEDDNKDNILETELPLYSYKDRDVGKKNRRRDKKPGPNMLKPEEYRSFVAELRSQYEELNENKDLLIETIAGIMREVKVPEPPKDFCIEDGSKRICSFCQVATSTLAAAVRHYQEKHGPRYLVCYACGYDFTSTTTLYRHEHRCRAPDARIVQKARKRSVGNRTNASPFMQFYPPSYKADGYPCAQCSAVFGSRAKLEAHENLHKGLRPYRCTQCTYAFISKNALKRHLKLHSDVEYICDYCKKAFKYKWLLVSHVVTHMQLREHVCEHCNRRFRQRRALTHHVNTVHMKLPPPCACQICDKRYPRMSLLKVHMNKVHGLQLMTRGMFLKALPAMPEIELQQAAKIIMKSDLGNIF